MNFLSRLVGWRTVIINAALVIGGVLRVKNPDRIPDEATLTAIINGFLDLVFSVEGAGVINVLLRLATRTPVFKATA